MANEYLTPEKVRSDLIDINPHFLSRHYPNENRLGRVLIDFNTRHNEIFPSKIFMSKLKNLNGQSSLEKINPNEVNLGENGVAPQEVGKDNEIAKGFLSYIVGNAAIQNYINFLAKLGHFESSDPQNQEGEYYRNVGRLSNSFVNHYHHKVRHRLYDEETLKTDSLYEASIEHVRRNLLKVENKPKNEFPENYEVRLSFDLDYVLGVSNGKNL